MGAVTDYFRPVQGKTYCEMLDSFKLHQWSVDGLNWITPNYYTRHKGGSARNYPNDGRQFLSFWGDRQGGFRGGCCATSYTRASNWGKAFKLFYGGIDHIFNIGQRYII